MPRAGARAAPSTEVYTASCRETHRATARACGTSAAHTRKGGNPCRCKLVPGSVEEARTLLRAFVRVGVVLHDAGKVLHPAELDPPGETHEPAGEALLLQHGVSPEVARVCVSHARWQSMSVSFEEVVIALADKLWKGVRHRALEEQVIDAAAERLGTERWDVFVRLDSAFEHIASLGCNAGRRLAAPAGPPKSTPLRVWTATSVRSPLVSHARGMFPPPRRRTHFAPPPAPQPPSSKAWNAASSRVATPSFSAFSSLVPASSPTTR